MKWSSAVSDNKSLEHAIEECATKIQNEMGEQEPHLLIAFVSSEHQDKYDNLPKVLRQHLKLDTFIGCSSGGVIGDSKEIEYHASLAMTAAHLPNVEITPFKILTDNLPDGDAPPEEWRTLIGLSSDATPQFILLADPFSIGSEHLLMGLDYAFPESVKVGGIASGGDQPGSNALYLGNNVYHSGIIGLALTGDIKVDTIVAQGCRPIGHPMHVTNCNRNTLLELDSQTPLEALREIFAYLSQRDQNLVHHSLFLGVVMDELQDTPQLGDFLIRNIIGVDAQRGSLKIGEVLKEGQTVQFHLRDADTSTQDLNAMLDKYATNHSIHQESGALLFSCLGRGSQLYGYHGHDTAMFREKLGNMPLTGFFCNGEIGRVKETTFLHGYTSSFGIFSPRG